MRAPWPETEARGGKAKAGWVSVGSLVYSCVGQRGKESRAARGLCIAGALVKLQVLKGGQGVWESGNLANLRAWRACGEGTIFSCLSLVFPLLRIGLACVWGWGSPL